MRKLFFALCLSIGGLAAALFIVEIGFRLFMPAAAAPWNDRPVFYFQAEDSPTLQDYPYTPQKPEHTFRIAVIGDSFTFAPYMQFTDAFPKKLELMLNLNHSQTHAQVINYGVPAYSTTHEVPKVKQAIKEGADLVILQITLNDPELKGEAPIGITNFSRFGPLQPSEKMKSIFAHWHSLEFVAQRLHNNKTRQEYVDYFLDLFAREKTFKPFVHALLQISEACKESHTSLVAVVFPLFGLPLDEKYPFYPIHEKVAGVLDELQVTHLDISDIYKGIPLERLQVMPGVDRHPNEIAHRMAAERLYQWLVEEKLLPEELIIRKRFKKRTQIIKEEPYS